MSHIFYKLLRSIDDGAPEEAENQLGDQAAVGGIAYQSVITPKAPIKQMKVCAVAAESAEVLAKKVGLLTAMWKNYEDTSCVIVLFDDTLPAEGVTPSNPPEPMQPPKEYPLPEGAQPPQK